MSGCVDCDIKDFNLGVAFLRDVPRREWSWDRREWYEGWKSDGSKKETKRSVGYVAQELEAAVAKHPGADKLNLVYHSNPNRLETTPANMLTVFHNAILELDSRLQKIESQN